ncbi:MAG: GvpL/GvpF family gas vesicle protein [Gaiellaceae bacterium]|jgi:Gas vesicle synthesis protein GvpL/GvpF
MTAADAVYVYGIVPSGTSGAIFAGVTGMDAAAVRLVDAEGVAAIASFVPLAEFDTDALEQNLKDVAWLEQKVAAHNRVLSAAVGKATVLPLRFGAIYRGEEDVRAMLGERHDFAVRLGRLEGLLELGVKALLDAQALRARLSASRGVDADESGGRAYMLRRRLERELDEEVRAFAGSCAEASHERLAAAAVDARANPVQAPEVAGGEMILNGAYLVAAGRERALRQAVSELEERFGADGVTYELTGPWPPYNFAGEEPEE